ncbi:DegT/DnrJ/EryC1/StrS family aminotransferase [Marinobacterium marinum]|uniref:DegT/DnrJ/EryC1/StrS family aminotransferase n=1 Tax=Marinobacterium marinum TaxID=2756129 RepID=A0A7W1WWK6_9GAMM|nr:DegT/DnrJ/EryC1/StrS family aminotransferase [Marinobacterium marinum]MBA4501526.1 DegT/DnrJ/EryC1/StrS family aminotransferase [Marinobacterium marinum]
MIPVTKPYFPSREKLDKYIDGIYERQWLTNNGQLVQELTKRLEDYLGVENLLLVSNGTLALQIAYRALGVSDAAPSAQPEAITTPFTFIATASSLKWDGVQPVFADIDPNTWCLNPDNIEAAITPNTRAIVPVHVFGNACDVEAIEAIAQKYKLKVIYDASHAFGVKYKGESLLKHGDAATLSFHATKLFHTGEGGAIIFKHKEELERAKKMINFGITGPECIEELGINAKMNELQAAMGLCVLDEIEANLNARHTIWERYARELAGLVQLQKRSDDLSYNAAYFPIVFKSEQEVVRVADLLKDNGILARRYFFPSLEIVEFLDQKEMQPYSKNIASRILCLPIYAALEKSEQEGIINVIKSHMRLE